MIPKIVRLIGSISFVIMFVAGLGPRTAYADDCLAQPNSSAPAGNHWYYHTDRATQRKCWYLRALDQPAQQPAAQTTSQPPPTNPIPLETSAASGGAPTSAPPGASTSPLPRIKMLSVVNSGAADQVVQQRANQTTSITAASPPQQNTIQVVPNEPARPATSAWPDAPTPPLPTAQDPSATPIAAKFAADGQDSARANETSNGLSEAKASVVSEPVKISLVAALGLVVAGFLFRIAMTARRRRIFIDRPEPHGLDSWNEHELRDEQQHAKPVYQEEDPIDRPEPRRMNDRDERELRDRQQPSGSAWQWNNGSIHGLQGSVTAAASDHGPRRPLRNGYESQGNPQRRGRDSEVANEIRKREDMLEQLQRDLDRMLQSPKVA